MRIGIDMRMAGTGEGISRYVEELVKNLALESDDHKYVLLFQDPKSYSRFEIPDSRFRKVLVKGRYYSLAEQTYFVFELLRLRLDLMHFASFNVPIFYPRKFIVTIHDIIHHLYPGRKKSRLIHRLAYKAVIKAAVARATKVISVSEA